MTEITYATIPKSAGARARWQAANCRKLARLMKRLRPEQHQQNVCINACGTAGCAMGWAALSNEFPGLQWMRSGWHRAPVVNGKEVDQWRDASDVFFGIRAWDDIFRCPVTPRPILIRQLYAEARRLLS